MRSIGDTISRINAASGLAAFASTDSGRVRLDALAISGANPGALKGWTYVPPGKGAMPLVVVLHGCTQTAAGYDRGAGWSELAERFGFALLFPEQQRSNNANLCFNWFSPEDVRRGSGEALSIREMVRTVVDAHAIDPDRIFVTGLSAGGAMAAAMLATYPDVFAGGAIIAGVPYGTARSVPEAFERMRGLGIAAEAVAGAAVRAASSHAGPWPTVSVWQGSADRTVDPANARALVAQWRDVHGVGPSPQVIDTVEGNRHRVWHDAAGRACVEDYEIVGMGHGTPIGTAGDTGCGVSMPFMLDVGISSSWHIAKRWGLLDGVDAGKPVASERSHSAPSATAAAHAGLDIQATIEVALHSAGLMR